jgi:hypothetical protein
MDPGRACAFLDAPHTPATMAATMLSSRTVSYRVEPDINRTWSGLACRFRLELESPITLPACRPPPCRGVEAAIVRGEHSGSVSDHCGKRAVAQGVKLGRPKIDSATERKVRKHPPRSYH